MHATALGLVVGVLICGASAMSLAIYYLSALPGSLRRILPAVSGDSVLLPMILFVLLLFLHVCLGWVIGYMLFLIVVRLKDYVVLYQSYDDNTVIDKLGRLVAAVGKVTVYHLQNAFDLFLCATGIRRDWQELIEEIEV